MWKNVDLKAGLVRLDVGTTKTGEGHIFPFTTTFRALLEDQRELGRLEREQRVVVPLHRPPRRRSHLNHLAMLGGPREVAPVLPAAFHTTFAAPPAAIW
jgi:integrase